MNCVMILRAALAAAFLLSMPGVVHAQNDKSFSDEYNKIVRDWRQEISALNGNTRAILEARQRFEARLEKCLGDIRTSNDGSPSEENLVVALRIAEHLSKSADVIVLSDQILQRNPKSDPAVFARLRGLIVLERLDDAEKHVRVAVSGADHLSDRFSMYALLLGVCERRGQWDKGVEYGSSFLKWCGRKIRMEGSVDVAVPSFVDLFAHCADEAENSTQLNQIVEQMLCDVTAAIDKIKENQHPQGANLKQLDFLFQLKHHLCCLSPHDDPGTCIAEWLAVLTELVDQEESQPVSTVIAKAANAAVGSLCLARDLDAIQKAASDCRTANEKRKPTQTNQPSVPGIAALRRLENMVEVERVVRGLNGQSLDFLDKVDWHHRSPRLAMGPTVVYVWMPAGRDPGLILRQSLSELRGTTTLPLIAVSPYTEGPLHVDQDAVAERRKSEGTVILEHTRSVSEAIDVGCIDAKLFSQKHPVDAFPQVYLLDANGKVKLAMCGIDRWRLKRLKEAVQELSQSRRH